MIVQYQAFGLILTILTIVLSPLVIGLVVALANASVRRTIIVASITASAIVFVGVVLVDAITRLAGPLGIYRLRSYSPFDLHAMYLGELLLSVGLSLGFAAAILGLREDGATATLGLVRRFSVDAGSIGDWNDALLSHLCNLHVRHTAAPDTL